MPLAPLANDQLCLDLGRSPELTLLLDLDGTLIPFAPTPEAAALDPAAAELLAQLQRAGVRLVIVSGRPRRLIEPLRRAVHGACWFAEHGVWRCDEAGVWSGAELAPELAEIEQVLEPFGRVPGARTEIKSQSVGLHWRLVDEAARSDLIAAAGLACEEWLEAHIEFERLDGEAML